MSEQSQPQPHPATDWRATAQHLEAECARLAQRVCELESASHALLGRHLDHACRGLCPDPGQPDSRDADCAACQALVRLATLVGSDQTTFALPALEPASPAVIAQETFHHDYD